uniref:Myb/SANT-like domain-containing protein n=1 Tax=Salix viminalis TaxID=40686 RepID=A0A6N2N3W3_SALVM
METGTKSGGKAKWTKETLHIFCDICIRAIDMGMRPSTHFEPFRWKYIVKSFGEQTGKQLQKEQLKNKWDVCKKDWRMWNKLISETGVGWSNELGTIAASDEWWQSRIQEDRGVSKFRQSGIEPSLKFKFDIMFSGVTATGQHAWAPSSGTVPGSDDDLETLNVGLQGADLEEGSGDSDENVDTDFGNYHSRGQQLLDSMSSRSDSTSANKTCQAVVFLKLWLSSSPYLVRQMTNNFCFAPRSFYNREKIEKCGLAS